MSLVDQVKEAIAAKQEGLAQESETQGLAALLESLADRGLLVRKPYSLPPLDTVGFGAVQEPERSESA
jgi:hypothetical protein